MFYVVGWKEAAELGRGRLAASKGVGRWTDVTLDIVLAGSDGAVAELHSELSGDIVHAPCGWYWGVSWDGVSWDWDWRW